MPYQAEISRSNPTCFLFLLDQSGSMSDPFAGGAGRSKADELATISFTLAAHRKRRISTWSASRFMIAPGSRASTVAA